MVDGNGEWTICKYVSGGVIWEKFALRTARKCIEGREVSMVARPVNNNCWAVDVFHRARQPFPLSPFQSSANFSRKKNMRKGEGRENIRIEIYETLFMYTSATSSRIPDGRNGEKLRQPSMFFEIDPKGFIFWINILIKSFALHARSVRLYINFSAILFIIVILFPRRLLRIQ